MGKFILSTLGIFISLVTFAQKDTIHLKNSGSQTEIVTDRAPQVVYLQFGGSAPLISVNYDRRFSKKLNGAGFSAGIGFWGASGVTVFSLPVSLNYLFGRTSHFIEVAGGATYISATLNDIFDNTTGSGVIFHINLGYRYQPAKGGFFFRGGLSPLFFSGEYVTSYYLGFGHNF